VSPQDTPAEPTPDLQLEIAHLLLIDVVGYSKLLVDEQIELLQELTQIVRSTGSFRAAEARGELIRVSTGDGMALVFFHSPEEPARCALEISRALHDQPSIQLRMGIHSGPVNRVIDVNEKTNIAGSGINVAQRVMDCGDAGHILLSAHVAEDLYEYRHWQPYLHDLGECEVKYGLRLHLFNLYKDGLGNPQVPEKLRPGRRRPASAVSVRPISTPRWPKVALVIAFLVSAIALIISSLIFFYRAPPTTMARAHAPIARALSALAAIPEKSIAVLPFENLSNEKENAYFADGVQDEILTGLSRVADLKVISRTSVMQYKAGPKRNLREVATDLGVAHVLEGTVQRAGGRVRVNAQLINARTDSQLWAERYDRDVADVFAIESELAGKIVAQLQAKISPSEKAAIERKPTDNVEAYDAYLSGLAFEARYYSSYSPDLIRKATAFYERAVQLDPNFALAWARVSRANGRIYYSCDDTTCIARREAAKRALENAQKLEPNSPETLLALGYHQYLVLRDYGPAKVTFERVSKMLPGSSEVAYALAVVTRRKGQWDQSVAYWERALALDPRNMQLLMLAAETYDMLRQFPAALRLYERALDITPNDPDVIVAKACVYQAQGDLQEAARLLSEINEKTSSDNSVLIKINQLRLERRYTEVIRLLQARLAQFHFDSELFKGIAQVNLAFAQYLTGDRAGAKITAEQARNTLDQVFRNQPDSAYLARLLSLANAALGEKDSALKEAERAIMLEPRAQDAISGPGFEENLALIQTIFGENSRAIPTLTQLLQTPYMEGGLYGIPITPALLRFDPIWDPLRADPAFQKLCKEKPR
jgi:TolB-like protein/class 3 adenylate cyclase/Flp pilus assembly protein TadD